MAARPKVLSARAVIGEDRHAQLGQRRQQADDLLRLAALREHQHHVLGVDAAQVAVDRLGRVQAVAASAGRGQRGHDLLADQARLAHAGDDHVAAALRRGSSTARQNSCVEPFGHLGQGAAFGLEDLPGVAELLEVAERMRGLSRLCFHESPSLTIGLPSPLRERGRG